MNVEGKDFGNNGNNSGRPESLRLPYLEEMERNGTLRQIWDMARKEGEISRSTLQYFSKKKSIRLEDLHIIDLFLKLGLIKPIEGEYSGHPRYKIPFTLRWKAWPGLAIKEGQPTRKEEKLVYQEPHQEEIRAIAREGLALIYSPEFERADASTQLAQLLKLSEIASAADTGGLFTRGLLNLEEMQPVFKKISELRATLADQNKPPVLDRVLAQVAAAPKVEKPRFSFRKTLGKLSKRIGSIFRPELKPAEIPNETKGSKKRRLQNKLFTYIQHESSASLKSAREQFEEMVALGKKDGIDYFEGMELYHFYRAKNSPERKMIVVGKEFGMTPQEEVKLEIDFLSKATPLTLKP